MNPLDPSLVICPQNVPCLRIAPPMIAGRLFVLRADGPAAGGTLAVHGGWGIAGIGGSSSARVDRRHYSPPRSPQAINGRPVMSCQKISVRRCVRLGNTVRTCAVTF